MNRTLLVAALATALISGAGAARAAGFTYHGNLQDAGKPADGKYDIELTLYSAQTGGSVIGGPLTIYAVPVRDGSFSTEADFGPLAKSFSQSYVGVKVRAAGSGNYAALDARASVTPEVNTSCPGSWSLDGNAGNPLGSYLGTADAKDVVFMVGGQEVGRFIAGTKSFAAATDFTNSGFESFAVSDGQVQNTASYAFGGGKNGTVSQSGSFVWGDSSANGTFEDTAANQFIVQATGGMGINTARAEGGISPLDATLTIGNPLGNGGLASIKLKGPDAGTTSVSFGGVANLIGTGFPSLAITSHNNDGTNFTNAAFSHNKVSFNGGTSGGAISVGTTSSNGNGAFLSSGGVWTDASSRTFKEAFERVDASKILAKVTSMPVTTWFYKDDHDEGRHMGPMAEDFAATFGLGNDEKHIGTVDESGVAFAAIQGLNEKVENENTQLKRENAALHDTLDDVLARLRKLEAGKGQ